RSQRACAAVGTVDHVDPAAELVAEALGLSGALAPVARLVVEAADEPADDEAAQQQETRRERDTVVDERRARRMEVTHAPPLDEPEVRNEREAGTRCRRGRSAAPLRARRTPSRNASGSRTRTRRATRMRRSPPCRRRLRQ